MWTAKTLIRLDGCPGCSESLQGAQVVLLVLSCCGLYRKKQLANFPNLKLFSLFANGYRFGFAKISQPETILERQEVELTTSYVMSSLISIIIF